MAVREERESGQEAGHGCGGPEGPPPAEVRARLLARCAPVALAIFDRQMRFLAVSERFVAAARVMAREGALGEADLLGRRVYEVFPGLPAHWRALHQRCLAGATERHEEELSRADGGRDWIRWEIGPWRDDEGRIGGLVLWNERITEHKVAERALRAGEARYRAVFDQASAGVAVVDTASGRFLDANRHYAALLGYTREELLGLTWLDVTHPDDREAELEGVQRMTATQQAFQREKRYLRKDGDVVWVSLTVSPVAGAAGAPATQISVVQDITARRRAEADLARSQERFHQAQKLESIGRLAGGVAHDFNNLLTVILSCANGLEADLASGEPASIEDVAEIQGAARRAADLTRQLLAFARKQPAAPLPLDLNEAVRGCQRMLGRLLGEDVELRTDLLPDLWTVVADLGQVEQVLLNLAVNARDAMPDGGILTIETRHAAAHPPGVGGAAAPAGEWVRLVIRDTGTGMTPEARDHLFEPFFTTKGPGKGTGLGLATVYGIVHQAGGHLHVTSAPGQGTAFEICLPRADGPVRAAPPAGLRAAGGSEAVLVVEDEPAVRQVLARVLRGAGYQVVEAPDGRAALELGDEVLGALRLAVVDVVLPGLQGRAVAEALRRRHPGLRALFLSGYSPDGLLQREALEAGAPFLQKPFSPEGLLALTRSVIDGPAP